MGSIDRRLENLERRIQQTAEPEPSEARIQLRAILDELCTLKSSCAVYYRGGVRMEPENIPRRILGPGYTHAALWRLAVTRSVEAGKVPAERTEAYVKFLRGPWEREGRDPDPDAVVEWERNYVS
jgi:hypothetical protein